MCRVISTKAEFSNDLPLGGPLAHQLGAAAPAQNKAKRIQQNGFACPGFAGQHVQARLKRQLQMVNDQKITNIKCTQHSRVFALFRRQAD
jgi:hypothetical protein